MRVQIVEVTKGVYMSPLERTLVKARIRRRKWFPRIVVGSVVVSIYLFRIELALIVVVSVAAVSWKFLSDPINETKDIMRIRQ